jgi:hypothetical protein
VADPPCKKPWELLAGSGLAADRASHFTSECILVILLLSACCAPLVRARTRSIAVLSDMFEHF